MMLDFLSPHGALTPSRARFHHFFSSSHFFSSFHSFSTNLRYQAGSAVMEGPHSCQSPVQHQKHPHYRQVFSVRNLGALLQSCCDETSSAKGYLTHDLVVKSGLEHNTYLQNMLIQMYGQHGLIESAYSCFSSIQFGDQYSWNFIIKCFSHQGNLERSLHLFYDMQNVGKLPDEYTFVSILSACYGIENLAAGKYMHIYALEKLNVLHPILGTALVNMYGKCGDLKNAQKIFDGIVQHDQVAWNSMVAVYHHHGQSAHAFGLLEQMLQGQVSPDESTFMSVVSACTGDFSLLKARELHDQIVRHGFESKGNIGNCLINLYVNGACLYDAEKIFYSIFAHTVVCWTAIISGFLQHSHSNKAFQLLDQMFGQGVLPDQTFFVSTASKCSALQEGWKLGMQLPS